MMNIADLDIKQHASCFMPLRHPLSGEVITDEGIECGFDVYSPESDAAKGLLHTRMNQAISNPQKQTTSQELDRDKLDFLSGHVARVHGLCDEGKPLDVRKFIESNPWARDQLDAFIGNKHNFLSSSKPSSSVGSKPTLGTSPRKTKSLAPE